ncbi:CPBP family intramembrane glutamic endopeptidase [Brevundimonas goettingensis]|uniref:CPBP family intramembrane metalloprotease n=1 Tax=Brevundimonas goettingensis TaxID=2774190 RepID=A0A975C5L7_9CAUL|nr:CPBP family intramembrane glutamic endopeptidase [Brevundimonas goettingensis]QTC92002.1 CPBP family intramembrane metalloprotease [Brevundimonas goettingensis]
MVMATCALGFAALVFQGLIWPTEAGRWAAVALFVGLPLAGLRIAAGVHWRALFAPIRLRDLGIGLAFMPLVVLVSAMIALLVMHAGPTAANPIFEQFGKMSGAQLALFAASTLPQLFGEELITILPLLAVLTALRSGVRMPRRAALLIAWIVSALIFGALHLPTYGWHVAQALGVIFAARLALTLPYLVTKSLWASTVTHIVNDWAGFLLVMGITALKG